MENPKVILAILAVVLLISILLVLILQGLGPAIVVGDQADPTTDSREVRSGCVVGPVPEGFPFDPFYEKYCDAGGIPIISSGNVSDLALQQAYYIITNMLASIPEVRGELVANGAYFGVIGAHERTTSLPEYAHMNSAYWDQRLDGKPHHHDRGRKSALFSGRSLVWRKHCGSRVCPHDISDGHGR
jgi:hypothetical protein